MIRLNLWEKIVLIAIFLLKFETLHLSHSDKNVAKFDKISNVEIKSKKVIFEKDPDSNKRILKYIGDVDVKMSDSSTARSDSMQVLIDDLDFTDTESTNSKTNIKEILFSGGVFFNRQTQSVWADEIKIFVNEKNCTACGNVKILKNKPSGGKMTSNGSKARLNLDTEEIEFSSDGDERVLTTFDIKKKKAF
jgi:lipopolysaccharide export system protein LptA